MDSNIIKFRLSPNFINALETIKKEGESLHQVAKRILESSLDSRTQQQDTVDTKTGHTQTVVRTQEQDTTFDPDVLKEQLKAELREELVGEINEVVKINLEVAKDALLGE